MMPGTELVSVFHVTTYTLDDVAPSWQRRHQYDPQPEMAQAKQRETP
jgi:hypothetical protein